MLTKHSLFLKKHTRRVLICKHALPVFAFLLASLMIVWPLLTPEKERLNLPLQKSTSKTPSMDMENVRFYAQDDKHRTIGVTAQSVKEIDATQQIARLEKPVAIYTLADGDILTSQTDYGLVYQTDKYFLFDQPIQTTSKSGYTAKTQHVKATYEGVISSDYLITVNGPSGTLKADGFHLQDKGNLIDFKGKTDSNLKFKEDKIHITTNDGATLNRIQKTLTGRDNVHVYHQENVLTADRIILYYTEQDKIHVQKIEAKGHVVVDNGTNKIVGNEGIYNPLTEEMSMEGDVKLYQGKSYVAAQKAMLNMQTGESRLLNEQKSKERIKGTFLLDDIKTQDKK